MKRKGESVKKARKAKLQRARDNATKAYKILRRRQKGQRKFDRDHADF